MDDVIVQFDSPETVSDWKTVDDVVMGGCSDSRVHWVDDPLPDPAGGRGCLRFDGEVSLANNGGFCSTRQETAERGRPGLEALSVLLRGDGKRYKWTLRTADAPDKASWRLPFETEADSWGEITLPLADFELWRRGTHISSRKVPDPERITAFGLLISDGQAGGFGLDVARIGGRKGDPEFTPT